MYIQGKKYLVLILEVGERHRNATWAATASMKVKLAASERLL